MQASARLSSSAASKKAGVSSAITRSCYRTSRGKAHAAPLSAQQPPPKGQKRLTKQERKFRIVEFVEKFRASNDGKFPSITNVCQQVGGSHYTVREAIQELKYNHTKLQLGTAKAVPVQGTVEVAEHSVPKDEAMVAQLEGRLEHLRPKDDSGKNPSNSDNFENGQEIQDVGNLLISQKDAALSAGVEKTETWKSGCSSHHNVETQAAKTFKTADGPTLSDQTESKSMKNKSSVSLEVEAKSDPGNQQRETEANKLALENTEKLLNASESSVSDQSGSDKVIKANTHDREHNPKHEPEESIGTGLLGSLKSLAYGFRNFWNKL